MTRNDQRTHNHKVIAVLLTQMGTPYRIPSYRAVSARLNAQGLLTSRGNTWTPKRLVRMLQRHGISGLHGLKHGGVLKSLALLTETGGNPFLKR